MKSRYIVRSGTCEAEGPIVPWGRDEGILERAWSSRVASKLFFFSIQVEIAESFCSNVLILLWRASRSPHGPLTTALTALTAQLFASAL